MSQNSVDLHTELSKLLRPTDLVMNSVDLTGDSLDCVAAATDVDETDVDEPDVDERER